MAPPFAARDLKQNGNRFQENKSIPGNAQTKRNNVKIPDASPQDR
jgi:hypothetical protein